MQSERLKEVVIVFLKLGMISFGGPAAHIALMESELIEKRKWITREHFLDLIGATSLVPGPNSTEMAMHCGFERAGLPGLIAAGIFFIVPAATITAIFAYLYVRYGQLPALEPYLFGVKPAIISIIASAIFSLGKKAFKNPVLLILGFVGLVAAMLGVAELIVLLLSGGLAVILLNRSRDSSVKSITPFILSVFSLPLNISYAKLFLIFLKIGATLFGSGYVLISYLETELVVKNGWITHQQLLDAVAVGQFTPGPLFSTATFIGYVIAGGAGAVIATVGIFLPSFIFVILLNPMVSRIRSSKIAGLFLDGINVGSIVVMLVSTLQIAGTVLLGWREFLIFLISTAILLLYKNINATYIVAGSILLGYILFKIQIF